MKKYSRQDQDKDYHLLKLLTQAKDLVAKLREQELRQYGITSRRAAILYEVQRMGGEATPAEIARRTLREAHTISTILSRMEKDGLIKKTKDLNRKNLIRVVLTEKGQQAYQQSTKRESIHRVASSLDEAEREELRAYLQRIRDRAFEELQMDRRPPFMWDSSDIWLV